MDDRAVPVEVTAVTGTLLARSRRMLWTGIGLQVLGVVWDVLWHRRNPGALETGLGLLEAHGITYLGILVVGVGALVAFLRTSSRPGPLSWYALAGYGALAQVLGGGWDAWAHAMGYEVAVAHLLSRFGFILALSATVLATLSARGGSEGPG